jgi:hypothetical protein
MKIEGFAGEFEHVFPISARETNDDDGYSDPVPEIDGDTSPKVLWLLNLAYSFLDPNEAYLETKVYHGKSLVAALRYNDLRPIYACDNFCLYHEDKIVERFTHNMRRCRLTDKIFFFNSDFRDILNTRAVKHKVGVYFCNSALNEDQQYDAIVLAEPLLADDAIVIVGDWCCESIRKGTFEAFRGSDCEWELIYELPARGKADCKMWWNGIGLFSFKRKKEIEE